VAISLSRQTLLDSLIEIAGYKAGVVVDEDEVTKMTEGTSVGEFLASGRAGLRIRSEEIEEATAQLLYAVGNTESPNTLPIGVELHHRYKSDPKMFETLQGVLGIYIEVMPKIIAVGKPGSKLDPGPLLTACAKAHGKPGLDIAMEMLEGANRDMHRSPWGSVRLVDWKDEVELKELFESEKLETPHGRFFDQRFIDYLHRNFDDIDSINWRKFEGLTAEFFEREGFRVEIGPGRGDDGIDVKVFPKEAAPGVPPLIIIQCKRQKAKIDKVLVKSVYADMLWEKAESGMIVTTSTFAPGAETTRTARAYKIEPADRETVREWIGKMHEER
jgi:restriction system protein